MSNAPAPPTWRGRLWSLLGLPWRGLRAVGRFVRAVLTSFRFWVLVGLGVLLLIAIWSVLSDRYTPLTTDAFVQAYVVQVAPQVEGQVIAVRVKEDDRVRRGDVLFELDPRPFDHEVARLEAKLASAERHADRFTLDVEAARAEHTRLEAEDAVAKAVFDQEERIFRRDATTERRFLEAQGKYRASRAAVDRALKEIDKARQTLDARIGSEHAIVAEARAELATARLRREWATVTAPADGTVTELQLRAGAYAKAGQSVLTVIDDADWFVVANLREGSLEHIADGRPAIISFGHYPGRLYAAEVSSLARGVGQGQGVPSGHLPDVPPPRAWVRPAQRFPVRLRLTGDGPPLRVGMTATVSVYAETEGRLPPVTQGVHRVLSLLDYLY